MKKNMNLHLDTVILEPEFDLMTLTAKPLVELQPLLLVRMRAFLEETGNSKIEVNEKEIRDYGLGLEIKIEYALSTWIWWGVW